MRLRHGDAQEIRRGYAGCESDWILIADDEPSVCIEHAGNHRHRLLLFCAIGNFRRHVQHRLRLRNARLQPRDTGRTVVRGCEIFRRRFNQMHRTIKPAIDRKISAQRRDVRKLGVIHAHGKQIRARFRQLLCDFKTKCSETAAMFAQRFAVQINICHQARRLEPQKISFADFRRDV